MKGRGNSFSTLLQKLYFKMIPTSDGRTEYIMKHKNLFRHVGQNLFYQPRTFPSDPELISFGKNVNVASGVQFINHDIISFMLRKKTKDMSIKNYFGVIEIGDDVMIGANSIILPDVKIGSNVIIGAGSIVTKNIPDNSVVAGVPAKVIGPFDKLVEKRKIFDYEKGEIDRMWEDFNKKNGEKL